MTASIHLVTPQEEETVILNRRPDCHYELKTQTVGEKEIYRLQLMNHNSINFFFLLKRQKLEIPWNHKNTHLSSNPGALIASGLTVVCQVKGFLKTNLDSSAYLALKPSTYCMIELSSSSFSFVNSNLPPEPPLAEVHCAALCRA